MAENSVERKLRAILAADVKGYSKMMGEDEVGTYQTLTVNLQSIRSVISEHKGRVFSSPGDAVMAEFSSVVDAVQCAVELQDKIETANADAPEDKKMRFRIGVNLGDVIHDGEQVYGDGVNIAARIETLAEPGGVSISKNVYRNVGNKLKFGYEYQGEHQVKNIANPVRVYKVLTAPEHAGQLIGEPKSPKRLSKQSYISILLVLALVVAAAIWQFYTRAPKIEPASVEKMAHPLPEKPSIAVLPFDNMSGDPEQEYFSDGISEQIITSLSNVPHIFVIARNSTFVYKNKPVKIQQIAEELGVQYILEGSVQRSDDQVRITAQLIDVITGHHLWAESYDRKMTDIFTLYDEITLKIISELQVVLAATDLGRASSIKTEHLKAYEKYLKGYSHIWNRTVGDTLEARKLAEESISLDPQYGAAYRLLAKTYIDEIYLHRTKSRKEFLEKAEKLIQKSIEYSGYDYEIHKILSQFYLLKRQVDKSIIQGQKAVDLNPNSASSNFVYGMVLNLAARYDEAIPALKKALRLNPVKPINYMNQLAFAYSYTKQYEKAISLWEQTIKRNPDYYYAHLGLTVAYQLTGKKDKAQKSAAELMRVRPKFSVSMLEKRAITNDSQGLALSCKTLREVGLPD